MVSRLVVTLTIRPQRPAIMCGTAALASMKGALTLTSKTASHLSVGTSQNLTLSAQKFSRIVAMPIPALLTTAWTESNADSASSTTTAQPPGSRRSRHIGTTQSSPAAFRASPAMRSARSRFASTAATRAPAPTSARVIARPSPPPAPLTMTTFPATDAPAMPLAPLRDPSDRSAIRSGRRPPPARLR